MSQLIILSNSTTPTSEAILFIADADGNETNGGGTRTVTFISSSGDLDIVVDEITNEVDVTIANKVEGSGTTIEATTDDILSFPLGLVAGTYQFEARVKAYNASTPTGAGYNIYATFITDGTTATLIGQQSIFNETMVLEDADAYFIASGNNAVLQVLGVTGLTINWAGETERT